VMSSEEITVTASSANESEEFQRLAWVVSHQHEFARDAIGTDNLKSIICTILNELLEPTPAMIDAGIRALNTNSAREQLLAAMTQHNDAVVKMRLRWRGMVGSILTPLKRHKKRGGTQSGQRCEHELVQVAVADGKMDAGGYCIKCGRDFS